MSRKRTAFLLSLILMLVLAAGMSLAQDAQPMAAHNSAEGASPQASVGSGFTYQGRLEDGGGNPVDDTCDLDFTLWNTENGGTLIGHQIVFDVDVDDGNLAVLLNSGDEFGADAFEGEARWLKIGVKCSGDADWSVLPGRQLLSAAPYALSLRPGAVISGTVSGGPVLNVSNQAGGTALYAGGDVAQEATAAGLVKAAVYTECANHTALEHRDFNTVNGNVTVFPYGFPVFEAGACTLDFNFDLSERFWVAMAYDDTNATMASCTLSTTDNNKLICKRWDSDGNRASGDIMVLVY